MIFQSEKKDYLILTLFLILLAIGVSLKFGEVMQDQHHAETPMETLTPR